MNVHRALFHEHLAAPHLVEQLRTRVHAFGMGHEEMQQPEFGWPQLDGPARSTYAMSGGVQLQLP